jgi:hypothetical protein
MHIPAIVAWRRLHTYIVVISIVTLLWRLSIFKSGFLNTKIFGAKGHSKVNCFLAGNSFAVAEN